jgi:hypothetical protein
MPRLMFAVQAARQHNGGSDNCNRSTHHSKPIQTACQPWYCMIPTKLCTVCLPWPTYPGLHEAMLGLPAVQVREATLSREVPHVPQWLGSVSVWVSQPLLATPSQSPYLQRGKQAPAKCMTLLFTPCQTLINTVQNTPT